MNTSSSIPGAIRVLLSKSPRTVHLVSLRHMHKQEIDMGRQGKPTLVIQNVTLIDGAGNPPTLNQAMVIEGKTVAD
jgi:hypothetical protein